MGYKTLSNGIYVPQIALGKIRVEGLYLRLNNKLILQLNALDLSGFQNHSQEEKQDEQETHDPLKAEDILNGIKKFLFVISYFEQLDIKSLVLADNKTRTLHYDGKEYKIFTPEFIANFGVEDNNKTTDLYIHQLDIVRFDLQVQGKFSYQNIKKTLEMDIAISPKEFMNVKEQPMLFVHGITDFYKIDVEASSSHLYNLEVLKPYISQLKNKTLNEWLFKNIRYDVLKLHSLSFQSTLDKQFFTKLQKSLALDLAIESPQIYLAPNIQPITATRVIIYMRDENLSFLLKEPMFSKSNLDGSEVSIRNIFTQPLGVHIDIHSPNAALNDDMADLLKHYGIDLPFRSPDQKLQLDLDIDLNTKRKTTQVALNGSLKSKSTTLSFGEQTINVSNLNLTLANTPQKAYIQLFNTKINYANTIQGTLDILWNLKNSKLQGEFNIEHFLLQSKAFSSTAKEIPIPKDSDELTMRIIRAINQDSKKDGISEAILKIDKTKLPKLSIVGNLEGQNKNIEFPDFGINAWIGDENSIEISDISKISSYSPLLQYFGISTGSFKITSKDFKTMRVSGHLDNLLYPLYDKQAHRLSQIDLAGVINEQGIFIGSKNRQLMFIKERNVIKMIIDGYDLYINEIFTSKIPVIAQANAQNEAKSNLTPEQRKAQMQFISAKQAYERAHDISPHLTYLETRKMDFYINDYVIPSDLASVSIHDEIIRADVSYGNGVANVDIANSSALLRMNNFSDDFLNKVWRRKIFSGGLFDFVGVYDNGALKGKISMQNTTYRDLGIVQNVLGLIDTIPALLTFRKPGLNAEGYEVKNGNVHFLIDDTHLILENINLAGSSIDIEGGGLVDLKTKELNVVLKASTLKTLADIIGKIPLFDYVILGKDGKFSTGIVMKGTLDKPKSEVSVAEDLLFSPLEMVGRILKPVDNLLSGLSDAIYLGAEKLDKPKQTIAPQLPMLEETLEETNAQDTPKTQ